MKRGRGRMEEGRGRGKRGGKEGLAKYGSNRYRMTLPSKVKQRK